MIVRAHDIVFVGHEPVVRETEPEWLEECRLAEQSGRTYQLILRRKPVARSRQAERYHFVCQCELWAKHIGFASKLAAHYDLLDNFPCISVDEDGNMIKKTFTGMSRDEHKQWIFETCMVGMAENGVACPDPTMIYIP